MTGDKDTYRQKNYPPAHLFANVYLGAEAAAILKKYEATNATKQRVFDLFLGLVYGAGQVPEKGLDRGGSDVKTTLALQTTSHVALFDSIKAKWGLKPWETIRYIIVEGDRILQENPLLSETLANDPVHQTL